MKEHVSMRRKPLSAIGEMASANGGRKLGSFGETWRRRNQ